MYIDSITREWSSCFKQTIMNVRFRGKKISIVTNYLDDMPTFKSISVLDKDTFRECGKTPILGKFKTVYDTILQRKRK